MDMEQVPVGMDKEVWGMFDKADEEKKQTAVKEAARVIKSLDGDFSLSAWGYTQKLKVTRGDEVDYIRLQIKSVGVADVIEQTEKNAPRPPSKLQKYKKGSAEAREWGYNFDFQVREQDNTEPDYLEKLAEHNRRSGQIIMLHGLAYDIKDPGNPGVLALEGSDLSRPNKINNVEVALAALKRMGISGGHYAQILKDIRGLTEDIEEQEKNG
jgi:hypothetical protein